MFNVLRFFLLSAIAAVGFSAHAADIDRLAKDKWLQVSSRNFEITTDLDPERAQHLAQDMESFRLFLVKGLGFKTLNGKPLKILAIGTLSNFNTLDLPMQMKGVFNINSSGYAAIVNVNKYRPDVAYGDSARHTLLHEYYHFLLRFSEQTDILPMWYDEGMAEYWSTFRFDGKKIYIGDDGDGGVEHSDKMMDRVGRVDINSKVLFNSPDINIMSDNPLEQEHVVEFYAKSFYFIHYFNSSPARRESLNTYIKYLNLGYDADKAFNLAFKMSYSDLDDIVLAYVQRKLTMRVFSDGDKTINFPKFTTKVVELDEPGLYRNLADILPRFKSVDRADTRDLLLKSLALNPNDSEAKIAVLARGYKADKERLINELENETPPSPAVLVFKGDQLRSLGTMLYESGQDDWQTPLKQARDYYRRALTQDPYLPLGYRGLGDVYHYMPTTETLFEGALSLDGASLFDRSGVTHASLADLLLRMNKPLDALPALRKAVAFSVVPANSAYSLILDNIELLNDLTAMKGEVTSSGFTFASGTVFTGKLVDGKPDGAGQLIRLNGSTYTGNFSAGLMSGKGKLVTYGGTIYDGEFQHGIASGKAKITYPPEQRWLSYEGDVAYGFPSGKGVSIGKSDKYVGDFANSLYHGKGSLTLNNGKTVLKGQWIQNRYVWPEKDGTNFVGYVSADGLRNGDGYCRNDKPVKVRACSYQNDIEAIVVRN